MKHTAEKIAPALKNSLAIIKRIDELPGWETTARQKRQQPIKQQQKEQSSANPFENWIMPEEPHGYIKAKTNDFL